MAAPLSSATLVNAIIFASYGAFTRVWDNIFENGKHPNDGDLFHGTMTSEGAVFIERGEGGIHELIRRNSIPPSSSSFKKPFLRFSGIIYFMTTKTTSEKTNFWKNFAPVLTSGISVFNLIILAQA